MMDLKNLSSNWKKLQETLRKESVPVSSSTKRKASDREIHVTQHGVKRRRAEISQEKTSKQHKSVIKKGRMSEVRENGTEKEDVRDAVTKTISRDSTVSISDKSQTQVKSQYKVGKPNEGRSLTLVVSCFFPVLLVHQKLKNPNNHLVRN